MKEDNPMLLKLVPSHFLTLNFGNVYAAAKLDKDVMLADKVMKMVEENGELAQAYLALKDAGNKSKSAGTIQEEAVDVLLVALDIALVMTEYNEAFLPQFILDGINTSTEFLADEAIKDMTGADSFYFVFSINQEISRLHSNFDLLDMIEEDNQIMVETYLNEAMESIFNILGFCYGVIQLSGIGEEELKELFNRKTQKWLDKATAKNMVGG